MGWGEAKKKIQTRFQNFFDGYGCSFPFAIDRLPYLIRRSNSPNLYSKWISKRTSIF